MTKHLHSTGPGFIHNATLLCVIAIAAACGGGGGGGGGSSGDGGGGSEDSIITAVSDVSPIYGAAPNWNDYVRVADPDTACDGSETPNYDACIHGGDSLVVTVSGPTSCAGVTAADDLGAFDWVCDDNSGTVTVMTTSLADGMFLSDLIDFSTPAWLTNAVTVTVSGDSMATTAAVWWNNEIVDDSDGGSLTDAGGTLTNPIFVATSDPGASYTIDSNAVGFVIQPGLTLTGPGSSARVIDAIGRRFLWVEGTLDATGDTIGVRFQAGTVFSVIRGLQVENTSTGVGLGINSNNNSLSFINVNNNTTGLLIGTSGNVVSDISADGNISDGVILSVASDNTLTRIHALNNGLGVVLSANSNDNFLSTIGATNNRVSGISVGSSTGNALNDIYISNNGGGGASDSGLEVNASGNTFVNVSSANNDGKGVRLTSANNNAFSNGLVRFWTIGSSVIRSQRKQLLALRHPREYARRGA